MWYDRLFVPAKLNTFKTWKRGVGIKKKSRGSEAVKIMRKTSEKPLNSTERKIKP
jgi:hypothetical protein